MVAVPYPGTAREAGHLKLYKLHLIAVHTRSSMACGPSSMQQGPVDSPSNAVLHKSLIHKHIPVGQCR